jgi:hypothetical protein
LLKEPVAATPAPAATAAPATPAPAAPAAKDNWWEALPADVKPTITAKGWDKLSSSEAIEATLSSYVNLEKLMGADKAGRTVVLPKENATPEEFAEFTKALGVPESADKYTLTAPKGLNEEVVGEAKSWMHEAGVPPILAQRLVDAVAKSEAAKLEAWEAQSQKEMQDLAAEWGTKFDDNAEIGRRAAKAAGLTPEQFTKIEMAVGTKNFMNIFMKFGLSMVEAPAPNPANNSTGGQFVMNKAEAQQKANNLRNNPDFQARYLSPNIGVRQQAISELEELMKAAAG